MVGFYDFCAKHWSGMKEINCQKNMPEIALVSDDRHSVSGIRPAIYFQLNEENMQKSESFYDFCVTHWPGTEKIVAKNDAGNCFRI